MKEILLVEDDLALGNVLKQYLEMQPFRVTLAKNAAEGWKRFSSQPPDLCILDIMLPDTDGLTLGRRIKKKSPEQPLIFLTARTAKEDILEGLKIGADDYICKPFEPEELVLRINNILRRSGHADPEVLTLGAFRFVPEYHELSGHGMTHRLTVKEADLLKYLITHRDRLVKKEEILVALWGENDYFLGRSLDVFISRIRKYLSAEPSVTLETIRGVGYVLRMNDDRRTTIDERRTMIDDR